MPSPTLAPDLDPSRRYPSTLAGARMAISAYLAVLQRQGPTVVVRNGLTMLLFAVLFAKPAASLAQAWWTDPNSGHGLLLAPLSLWLAIQRGLRADAAPQRGLGLSLLVLAVLFRYASDLAAELFVMRGSMLMALAALVVWHAGLRQLMHWWLPFTLVTLSIPIPEVILNTVALPLQFTASRLGTALLEWRRIPVLMTGNVIRIPGQELFVAEACSGLRSLTALISLSVLLGAMFLRSWPVRLILVALAIPVAILVNGVRVFLTAFLVLFVSPAAGQGFMHTSEGLLMFGAAFVITSMLAWLIGTGERLLLGVFDSTQEAR